MTGLPNTFQVFNIYIDRAMELLTDSEFRVLMFTTRHILGWQDRIDERQGHISISMLERGWTTKTNTRLAGCGLNRQTIIDAIGKLVEFGFLQREGKATAKGQKFTLQTDGIDWMGLETRHAEKQEKAKLRTAKANARRRAGTSNDTGTLDNTMQGTSDNTMLGTLDNTQTNPSSNPSSKPVAKNPQRVSTGRKYPVSLFSWSRSHITTFYEENKAALAALACSHTEGMHSLLEMSKSDALAVIELFQDCEARHIPVDQYPAAIAFTKRQAAKYRKDWSWRAAGWYIGDYKVVSPENQKSNESAPDTHALNAALFREGAG